MICCSDPSCAEDAAVSIQRQIDISAAAFCLPHGYKREAELKQKLENYTMVTLVRPPTDLEAAQARIQELEAMQQQPPAPDAGAGVELADQLETALHTLEMQGQALARARSELADRDQALQVMRRELERTRAELERLKANEATGERIEGAGVGPITPPPPTRPDPK